MSCDAPVENAAAQLARAALRHLAQRRLPPTPDQYAMAWRAVGGAGACRERDDLGAVLGPLIAHLLRQLDLPHRHWTAARKKEALGRLLAAHGSEPALLVERLNRLIDSWQSVPLDGPADPSAVPRAPGPVAGRAAASATAAGGPVPAAAHAPPPRLQRLVDDMTDLLVAVCDTVPALVEEEAWVRQQFDAIRDMLRPAGGVPDRRDMAQARALLRRTAEEHQRLLKMRRDSLQMMKTMIAQCIDWLRALTESSGRFGGKLNTFVEEIERSPDLPALAGTVRHLIEETRSMYAELDASKTDFVQASERARLLEDEVSRLAQAGCQLGFFASNTPHLVFDQVRQKSPIPLVSIVEATADRVAQLGYRRVGLLGTRVTMESTFYPDLMRQRGIEVRTPDGADREYAQRVYATELVEGIFKPESREGLIGVIRRMVETFGIEAIILGGTELPLILKSDSGSPVPLLDTAAIHVDAVIERLAHL